jgi:hypothetical protein
LHCKDVSLVIALVGGTAVANLSPDGIQTFMDAVRREGSGPGTVVSEQRTDFNGDSVEDAVLLFTYQVGDSRDEAHTQYLALIVSDAGACVASSPRVVGGIGRAILDRVEVDGHSILLRGRKYLSHDPLYCPSAEARVTFLMKDGELFETQGEWHTLMHVQPK